MDIDTPPVTKFRIGQKQGSRRPSVASSISLLTGHAAKSTPAPGKEIKKPDVVWKPNDANPRGKDKMSAKNVIDGRSLYSVRRENIASREMRFVARPPTQQGNEAVMNVEHLIEKNYIMGSRLSNATPEKFPKVIMPRFHRVADMDENVSYGMPRPPSRTMFQRVMDGIKREPSVVHIEQCPSLHDPVRCNTSDEFCEVLGPSSCQTCIENTNRFIGEQLQDMVFPMIDITTDKLIAPKLARLLKAGHRIQIRKKRLRDLGIEQDTRFNLHNRDAPLSTSTCVKCKKPIKQSKMIVTSPGRVSSNLYKNKATKADRF